MSSSSSSSSDGDEIARAFEQLLKSNQLVQQILEQHQKTTEVDETRRRRRRPQQRAYIERNRFGGATQLMADYFGDTPTYGDAIFRCRFRMSRNLFLHIVEALEARDPFFTQRRDALGKPGFTAIQKCTAALRQLGNGCPADHLNEYLRMGESTTIDCLKRFCRSMVNVFGGNYLRRPDATDCGRLLHMHEEIHGFPGMLGSIECMHWVWRNCPNVWKGQYIRGDKGVPTIILVAVASHDLWIWHAFFGVAGSNNDINVLNQSSLFSDVVNGIALPIQFTANGQPYNMAYYLADGIYPKWPVFISSPTAAADPKVILFKTKQESARKDVERAFGVLKMQWRIIKGPSRRDHMQDVMYACIIMHNMIIENEGPMVTQLAPPEDEASS